MTMVNLKCVEFPQVTPEMVNRGTVDDNIQRYSADVNPDYIVMMTDRKFRVEYGTYKKEWSCVQIEFHNGSKLYADYPSREEMYLKVNLKNGDIFTRG